jgi:ABC-type nitrate/sulfonate/bicarbonate transport system substrate-binding protein
LSARVPPDLYERLVDRLRYAEQFADAARETADEALAAFRGEEDVVAMAARVPPGLAEHIVDRIRHAEQYAEAARLMVEEALELLASAKRQE